MGPTYKIAALLQISYREAVSYCETVRSISGLGTGLPYKTIAQHLVQSIKELPSPERMAEIVRDQKPVGAPVSKLKPKKIKKKKIRRKPAGRPGRWNISRVIARERRFQFDEPSKPIPTPSYVVRTSYFDHERVSEQKLDRCPHGVSRFRVCAICDPEKFREMTGID